MTGKIPPQTSELLGIVIGSEAMRASEHLPSPTRESIQYWNQQQVLQQSSHIDFGQQVASSQVSFGQMIEECINVWQDRLTPQDFQSQRIPHLLISIDAYSGTGKTESSMAIKEIAEGLGNSVVLLNLDTCLNAERSQRLQKMREAQNDTEFWNVFYNIQEILRLLWQIVDTDSTGGAVQRAHLYTDGKINTNPQSSVVVPARETRVIIAEGVNSTAIAHIFSRIRSIALLKVFLFDFPDVIQGRLAARDRGKNDPTRARLRSLEQGPQDRALKQNLNNAHIVASFPEIRRSHVFIHKKLSRH